MYLLDTNHCSRIINGDSAVISRLQQKASVGVATSVILENHPFVAIAPRGQQRSLD